MEDNTFFKTLQEKYNKSVTSSQKEAIITINGPVCLKATAGSGKTSVLNIRQLYMISEHNIDPLNILNLSYSKSSALDMELRFKNEYGNFSNKIKNIKFSTVHSFANSVIYGYGKKHNITYKIIENKREKINKWNLIREIYMSICKEFPNDNVIDDIISKITYVKSFMLKPTDIEFNTIKIPKFKELYTIYEQIKKKHNLIDFSDMLTKTYELLLHNEALRNSYANKYKYIQLDEAQDASTIQFEIIKLLAKPNNNLFIVGDVNQCIFEYAGANSKIISDYDKNFKGAKILFMDRNFRCSGNIVNLADAFIKNSRQKYDNKIYTTNEPGDKIHLVKADNEYIQVIDIVNKIKTSSSSSSAILYRNNISAIPFIDVLSRNNIPIYVKEHDNAFFSSWILTDILNIMRLSCKNDNIELYEKIFYKIKGFCSKEILEYAKQHIKQNSSIFDIMKRFPKIKLNQIDSIGKQGELFKELSKLKPIEAINYILYYMEYNKYLDTESKKDPLLKNNIINILSIIKSIAIYTINIQEFINRISELQTIMYNSANNSKDAKVNLMAAHSSKGLEFETVYIVDMLEDTFPTTESMNSLVQGDISLLESEKNLCFVAITRAKFKLFIYTITNKNNSPVNSSIFFKEIYRILAKNNK